MEKQAGIYARYSPGRDRDLRLDDRGAGRHVP